LSENLVDARQEVLISQTRIHELEGDTMTDQLTQILKASSKNHQFMMRNIQNGL
jgi:hypothetical protein